MHSIWKAQVVCYILFSLLFVCDHLYLLTTNHYLIRRAPDFHCFGGKNENCSKCVVTSMHKGLFWLMCANSKDTNIPFFLAFFSFSTNSLYFLVLLFKLCIFVVSLLTFSTFPHAVFRSFARSLKQQQVKKKTFKGIYDLKRTSVAGKILPLFQIVRTNTATIWIRLPWSCIRFIMVSYSIETRFAKRMSKSPMCKAQKPQLTRSFRRRIYLKTHVLTENVEIVFLSGNY